MEQMTVRKLYMELKELMQKGQGDKKIIVADDNEGNGYHGIFYSVTAEANLVQENVEASNGLSDSAERNYENLVIIG